MGILRDFERRLEGAVEGVFARAFRSGVQPVELGKRLVRQVEDGRTVGVSRVYVPNVYTFELSAADLERFADYQQALRAELAGLAVTTARKRDWAMLGPARVEFETADDLVEGRFRLLSRVEAADSPSQAPAPATRPAAGSAPPPGSASPPAPVPGPRTAEVPGEGPRPAPRAPATLALLGDGGREEQGFSLTRDEAIIGRSDSCDIVLNDAGVSRMHARVVTEGDDFVLEDLDSTNGTQVNGAAARRRRLADGDVIKVGDSAIRFRRPG